MWDPGRGRLRAARSMLVGLVVAIVATTSHVAGGGGHTSWIAVVPAALVAAAITAAMAGRPIRRFELFILLSLAQAGVHFLSAYLHGMQPWHGASMLVTHTLGVAVTALLLARGEDLLWRLHAWLTPRALLSPPVVAVAGELPIVVTQQPRALPPVLGAVGRRGPPVGSNTH